MAAATITKYQRASSRVPNPNGGRASYTRKTKMLTTWDYFSAHYRREYGKEPDMDNQNHVLLASWFVVGASDQAFIRSRVSDSDRSRMICDCKDSAIRWVDEKRPHVVVTGPGWFCMGCLTEYVPRHHLTDLQIERNTWLTKERDLKEHVRSLNMVIDIARREIADLRQLLAASESLAEEYRQCALSSSHNA